MSKAKKICVLGEFAVGKTSLTRRYVLNSFSPDYQATLGVSLYKATANLQRGEEVALVLWDVEGGEYRASALDRYVPGASGAFLVSDVTRPKSVEALSFFAERFQSLSPGCPMVFAANKVDLAHQEETVNLARDIAKTFDASLMETSAADGTAVPEAFSSLANEIYLRAEG